MKNYLGKLLLLASLAVALTGAAMAELNPHLVRANIPFSFYAGSKLLPAGEYTFAVDVGAHLVTIGQEATGHRVLLLGLPQDSLPDYRAVLTFEMVDGEVYSLRKLQGPDLGVGFGLPKEKHALRVEVQKDREVELVAQAR